MPRGMPYTLDGSQLQVQGHTPRRPGALKTKVARKTSHQFVQLFTLERARARRELERKTSHLLTPYLESTYTISALVHEAGFLPL